MSSTEVPATSPSNDADDQNVNTTAGSHSLKEADSVEAGSTARPAPSLAAANGEGDQRAAEDTADKKNMEDNGGPGREPKHAEADREETPTPALENLSVSSKPTGSRSSLRVETGIEGAPVPPKKDDPYLDPTPRTPQASRSPTGTPSEQQINKDLPEIPPQQATTDNDTGDDSSPKKEDGKSDDSQPEIQTIMDQFTDETKSLDQEAIMSPRLELADQFRTSQAHFPSRKSSLEPTKSLDAVSEQQQHQLRPWRSQPTSHFSRDSDHSPPPPAVPPKSPPRSSRESQEGTSIEHSIASSTQPAAPPAPEPEPDRPFDFHRFLEQLRHRTADPVAKFLRSFLTEFGKRQWMVHEQVKIISDFLTFITNKMAQCEVWRDISDVEFDNAREGMEKLVMNRLYSQTFSPAIPSPPAPPRSRSRSRRKEAERQQRPGRRGQHQEDVERDDVLAQKIRIYSWVREQHLDIPALGSNGRRFLALAQQELLKIKGYRAPRDKVICVMNCCKVIFGLLRNSKSGDTSADSFVPLLIYVVLRANPEHLVSNIQYILRFRNQDKLGGEAGYYLSSLSGAIQFIETLDRTSLTVSDEEFEKNVEAAVSAIAERDQASESSPLAEKSLSTVGSESNSRSKEASSSTDNEENAAVSGILRTIQKPLTTIGRIFSDDDEPQREQTAAHHRSPPPQAPPQAPAQAGTTTPLRTQRQDGTGSEQQQPVREQAPPPQANTYDAQEAAARQASAEAAEARRIQRSEHNDVVEILSNMFPNLDRDVIDDVVRMKEGRVGLAVDACLALSAE